MLVRTRLIHLLYTLDVYSRCTNAPIVSGAMAGKHRAPRVLVVVDPLAGPDDHNGLVAVSVWLELVASERAVAFTACFTPLYMEAGERSRIKFVSSARPK